VSVVVPIATNQTKIGVLDPSGPLLQIKVGVLFGAFRPAAGPQEKERDSSPAGTYSRPP